MTIRLRTHAVLACLFGLTAFAQSSQPNATAPIMERQKEIDLALGSCPPPIASQAAVYVLEKAGYVKVRDGQNGFTAIVQRVRPESTDPQCMDAEASRTFLPRMLKAAELRSQGKSPEEIRIFLSDALSKGLLLTPTRPGIIYMLSNHNFNTNGKGENFPPHVMLYGTHLVNADLGVDGKDLGPDGNPKGPAFIAGEGSPFSLLIVPVASHPSQEPHDNH
jgi:hypothetical protein